MGHVEYEGILVQPLSRKRANGGQMKSMAQRQPRGESLNLRQTCRLGPGFLLLAWAILGLMAPEKLGAQLPQARLDSIFHPGGAQGTEIEVTISGADLDGLKTLFFSHPGIQAEMLELEPSSHSNPPKIKVTIAQDTPPGIYETCTQGYFGASNPRAFVVGSGQELKEEGTNHHSGKPLDLPMGATVNGWVDERAVDHYAVKVEQGKSYTIECLAAGIDSKLDASLVVLNTESQEVARARRGGILHFQARHTGRYVIQVHDFQFRGGPHFFYRLRFHDHPWIESVVPPAFLPEEPTQHTVYGYRLPGDQHRNDTIRRSKEIQRMEWEIRIPDTHSETHSMGLPYPKQPGDVTSRTFPWKLDSQSGDSNPFYLGKTTAPLIRELEPNNAPNEAHLITPPCEIGGHFYPARDIDRFQFEAKQGDIWWIEVFSDRLGQPTSPYLLIQRIETLSNGEPSYHDVKEVLPQVSNPLGRELDTGHRDSNVRFEPSHDGMHQLRLSDLFQHSKETPAHVYRLILRKPNTDFDLVVVASQPKPVSNNARTIKPVETLLRRGMTLPLQVAAIRRDGFNGPIMLEAGSLPNGVSCPGGIIREGEQKGWLFLTAQTNAPTGWTPPNVVGRSTVNDQQISHAAAPATTLWPVDDTNNQEVRQRLSALSSIAVIAEETAPVIITPLEHEIFASFDQSL